MRARSTLLVLENIQVTLEKENKSNIPQDGSAALFAPLVNTLPPTLARHPSLFTSSSVFLMWRRPLKHTRRSTRLRWTFDSSPALIFSGYTCSSRPSPTLPRRSLRFPSPALLSPQALISGSCPVHDVARLPPYFSRKPVSADLDYTPHLPQTVPLRLSTAHQPAACYPSSRLPRMLLRLHPPQTTMRVRR